MLAEQDLSTASPSQKTVTEQRSYHFSFFIRTLANCFSFEGRLHMQKQTTAIPARASRLSSERDNTTTQDRETYDYDEAAPRSPSSARRYTQTIPATPAPKQQISNAPSLITGWNWQAIKYKGLQIALGGLIIAFACDTLGYSAWNAINDHWTYGAYPTTHLSAQFGHGGLSHIVAFTDARKVEIIEIVNNHTNVYVATISSSDRRIVTLNVEDVNGDGRADLLIQIDGVKQEPCLLNTGKGFEWSVPR